MNVPLELIGITLAALLTVVCGLLGWIMLEIISLKVTLAALTVKYDDFLERCPMDKPCENKTDTKYDSKPRRKRT